jgi:hypothetical protein
MAAPPDKAKLTPSARGFEFERRVAVAIAVLKGVTLRALTVEGEAELRQALGTSCNGVDLFVRLAEPGDSPPRSIAIQAKWEEKNGGQRAFSQFLVAAERVDAHYGTSSTKLWVGRLPLTSHAHTVAEERGVAEIWGGPREETVALACAQQVAEVFGLPFPACDVFAALAVGGGEVDPARAAELRDEAARRAREETEAADKIARERKALVASAQGNFAQLYDGALVQLSQIVVERGFDFRRHFNPPGASRDGWPAAVVDVDTPCASLQKAYTPTRAHPVHIDTFRAAVGGLQSVVNADYLFENYERARQRLETSEARLPDVGTSARYLPTVKRNAPPNNLRVFYEQYAPKCVGYDEYAHRRWPPV